MRNATRGERSTHMLGQRALRRFAVILTALALLASLLVFGAQRRAAAGAVAGAEQASVTLHDLHALIFVWASGTPAVQRVARQTCAQMRLTKPQSDGDMAISL